MKKLKLIIFIFLMLVIPINIYAYDGETDKLYINIDILDNGDINVQELASLKGSYNGRLRDIRYADNTIKDFIGEKSDFEGSKIYNGTSIENLQVYGVLNYTPGCTHQLVILKMKSLFQFIENFNSKQCQAPSPLRTNKIGVGMIIVALKGIVILPDFQLFDILSIFRREFP